ncbi:MAG TPA: glycerophosphodiester phosphodiesterase family protein [bacterium]|nr:glycerophosphodiester phosphodiesterase family protein [bacterium]HQG45712.1 glycerophosphodiester phosphodiesterase family protein [bacterium]HQI49145.1 glycerophosphodiester phosphodiesterase family protein [bacterium]HQJ66073.1 glycerophosphodiester phosphodiesterase family protein [bacterium]
MDPFFIPHRPLLLAHRGASGHAPELTMAAFRLAAAMHADGCELDVQLSADGHVAVFHDETLRRTTGRPERLDSLNWTDLQELDAGRWFSSTFTGERIPGLEQILRLEPRTWRLNIELKGTPSPRLLAERVAELVHHEPHPERLIFTSFDPEALSHLATLMPKARRGLIFAHQWPQDEALAAWPIWSVEQSLLTRTRIQQAHARGIRVCAWTVNSVEAMRHLMALGVDAIITNYPDRYHQAWSIFSAENENSLDFNVKK